MLFQRFSAGESHSCGVTGTGQGYCWGRNRFGALGIGMIGRQVQPTAVVGGLRFNGVNAGQEYTCGVATDNRAYCWGSSHSGRLGDGAFVDRLSPVRVAGGLRFGGVTTSLSGFDTCGLTTTQRAYCWGSNFVGGLGDGTTRDHEAPEPVVGPI